jgi:hypothetical protein
MAITVEVGGVDKSEFVRYEGITWRTAVGEKGTGRITFRDFVGGFEPAEGQEIVIKDAGTAVFSGVLNRPTLTMAGPDRADQLIYYECDIGDYTYLTNKRRIFAEYTKATISEILTSIIATHLVGEGITLGTVDAAPDRIWIKFAGVTVTDAINQLHDHSTTGDARIWWIAAGKVLHSRVVGNVAAPATLDNTSFLLKPAPSVRDDKTGYCNLVILEGGTTEVPSYVVRLNAAEISARAAIEGNSGKYVHFISRINEQLSVFEMIAFADAYLGRHDQIPVRVTGRTRTAGFEPGQTATVALPNLGFSGTGLVESVSAALVGAEFWYTLELLGEPWQIAPPPTVLRAGAPFQLIPDQTSDSTTRVEPSPGIMGHDPVPIPTVWAVQADSGTIAQPSASATGIDHRREPGGTRALILRRGGGAGTGGCGGGTFPGYTGGAAACFGSRQTILEVSTTDADDVVSQTVGLGYSWPEFAANANFKNRVVVDPTNTYAAVVQYGSPGTLIVVHIGGAAGGHGLAGSCASNLAANATIGEPVWTSDGYLYIPNGSDGKVYIYDLRTPSAPTEVGSFTTSLTNLRALVASPDEAWLYGAGTSGFVSLDRADPEVLVEDSTAGTGAYESLSLNADGDVIGAAVRADSSNALVAKIAVSAGTIAVTTEANVAVAVGGTMRGVGAILDGGALIVWSHLDPTGVDTLEAHVFDLTYDDVTFIQTLSYTHTTSGNVGPAKSAYGRRVLYIFSGLSAQITTGTATFDDVKPVEILNPVPEEFGGTGHSEYQRGNLIVAEGRQTLGLIDPPPGDGYVLAGKLSEAGAAAWVRVLRDGVTSVEIDDGDTPYTLTDTVDAVLADATSGAITVDLPALADSLDRVVFLLNAGDGTNAFTADGDGAELIGGASTLVLAGAGEGALIIGGATQWETLARSVGDGSSLDGVVLLAGRSGGTVIYGSPDTGEDLTLHSNASADGEVNIADSFFVDEATGYVGIGTAPTRPLHITKPPVGTHGILYEPTSVASGDNLIALLSGTVTGNVIGVVLTGAVSSTMNVMAATNSGSGSAKSSVTVAVAGGDAWFEVGVQSVGNWIIGLDNNINDLFSIGWAANPSNTKHFCLSTGGNIGFNASAWGTAAVTVLAHKIGTAPGSSPADIYQQYSADWNGPGTAAPHFRTEEGDIIILANQGALTASDGTLANAHTRIDEIEAALQTMGILD